MLKQLTIVAIASVTIFVGACIVQADEPLLVGVAETNITPPVGFPMAGYYHERLATGQRDPLKAKAIVFRQGDTSAAFVVADLTGIARDLCVAVRESAAAVVDIPESHIVVSATHSHTAPDYTGHLYRHLALPDDEAADKPYAASLIDGLVSAVTNANENVEAVSLKAGVAKQEFTIAFNRRFVMKDGTVQTWQRYDNPNVVRAAGPIDPEVALLTIMNDDSGTTKSVVSNFALHLDTVGGQLWSADYPYYVEQSLQKRYGSDLVSIFGLGPCGDINHSDPSRKERNKTDVIGNSLAKTIDGSLDSLKSVENTRLQVHTATVDFPLQAVTQAELDRAAKLIPAAKSGERVDFFDLVSAYKAVMLEHMQNKSPRISSSDYLSWGLTHNWAGVGETLPVEVTTMTIGDEVAFVFLPGEVFVELGLAIKQASPFRTTFVIELSNCVETIYIPTRAAYAGGSYEVTNAAGKPGAGEMLVETSLELLRKSATTLAQ